MYVYKVMNSIGDDIYAFAKASNSLANKRLLKQFLSRSNVSTIVVCPHEYKYISEAKEIAQNLILFAPLTLQHDFASYNTFLNKLNSDEFIVYGAHTQNIPFIVELEPLEDYELESEDEKDDNNSDVEGLHVESLENTDTVESVGSTDAEMVQPNSEAEDSVSEEPEGKPVQEEEPVIVEEAEPEIAEDDTSFAEAHSFGVYDSHEEVQDEPLEEVENITFEPIEDLTEEDQIQQGEEFSQADYQDEIPNILADDSQEDDVVEVSEPVIEPSEYPEFDSQDDVIIDETPVNDGLSGDIEYTPLDETEVENYQTEEIDENLEEPEIDYSLADTDVVEDYQEPQIQYGPDDAMIEQAAKDVDKFFYEKLPQENVEIPSTQDLEDYASDELTEDDLNLIGDLTPEDENTSNYAPEDITINEQPPVVPIYEASDITKFEPPKLEPGDRVSNPKYGEGVVDKMVKYGNKMLCQIIFVNGGKRLMDPAMTEITKLS